MLSTKQSTSKTASFKFETNFVENKQLPRLYARWIKVDDQLVCRWFSFY
jgi:hypothetical protein